MYLKINGTFDKSQFSFTKEGFKFQALFAQRFSPYTQL